MAKKKRSRPVRIPVTKGHKQEETGVPPTPDDRLSGEELAAALAKAEEYDELLETLQRLKAEYANYQKRLDREREEYRQSCVRDVITKVLPVADSLERAIEAARQHGAGGELLSGVELVYKQFMQILEAQGVVPLESVGGKFDPRYHEALMVRETEEEPPDTVLSEVHRGYMIGDRVLRAAKVTVSRAPQPREREVSGEAQEE